ncbi:MAG TPA: ATP-binding protein [Methanobacterium sp.]
MTAGIDITHIKQTEDALRESEEKYRNMVETANEGILMADKSGIITFANRKISEMLGYSIDELLGTDGLFLVDNESLEMQEKIKNRKEGIIESYETKFIRKDGSELWTLISGSPIYDHNGVHIGNLGMYTDITKRKEAEDEIEKTIDELKRSNQELERFAYVSSHDLQEPLRMVTLYSQLLERRYKDRLDDDANDFIEYIVENAKCMKSLIDDLLEYSRITSQAKEFENIDLEKVLEDVLSNLSIPLVENNVNITHDSLPTVFADRNQMMQVFQNLITNAIKFRGEESPKIDISAQKGEKEWIFAVKDNGIGISPEHQKQIFEVFKRLHTRDEYPGTGIGLSITQKIIERHVGRIWVESESGIGSTFYFTLPIKSN